MAVLRFAALLVALVGIAAANGCGTSDPRHSDSLRIAVPAIERIGDPALATTGSDFFADSLVYSGLVKMGTDLRIVPDLAVSISTVSVDGRSYTFTIRHDARFASGRHCTAADVAYSLTRALRPEIHSAIARRYLGGILGARAVEDGTAASLSGVHVIHRLTVRIRLAHSDASFLQKLAFPVAAVIDRQATYRYHVDPRPGTSAGTGQWVLSGRDAAGNLTLTPRPHFYGDDLRFRRLTLMPIRKETEAIKLYRKGMVDVVPVSTQQFSQFKNQPDFQQSSSLTSYYALPLAGNGRWLAAELKRDWLVKGAPALSSQDSIVPSAVPDYASSPPELKKDAKRDLSFSRPGAVIQLGNTRDAISETLREALYRQWGQGRTNGRIVRVIRASSPLPDPHLWLKLVLPQTRSHWFRKTLRQAAELTNDPVSRMSSYSEAENWALGKGFIIPLVSLSSGYLIKPAVSGLQVAPLGIMPDSNDWSSVTVR